jgi:cation diffusion facilitator CzcD-associated flavoprotein CzcO
MSTILSSISRVAIIGAGAGGLVAARALREQNHFSQIDVYERRSDVGGVWNYTPQSASVHVPSTDVTRDEEPVECEGEHGMKKMVWVSAMYNSLGIYPILSVSEIIIKGCKLTDCYD